MITDKGECDRAYRYPVRIRGGKVGHTESGSSFNIGGRVGAGGTVKVFVSRGDKRADGVGRLTRTGGGGKWKSARGRVFRALDGRAPGLKSLRFSDYFHDLGRLLATTMPAGGSDGTRTRGLRRDRPAL